MSNRSVLPRPLLVAALACLAAAACGGKSEEARRHDAAIARDGNPPGLTMTVCGRVVAYRAGGGSDGRLELDRGAWDLVPAAPVAFEVLLVPGDRVCVHAELTTDERIRGAYVYWPGEDDRASDDPRPVAATIRTPEIDQGAWVFRAGRR